MKNLRGYMSWEIVLIVFIFILILACLYGFAGYQKVGEDGLTCNFGVGFFCWSW